MGRRTLNHNRMSRNHRHKDLKKGVELTIKCRSSTPSHAQRARHQDRSLISGIESHRKGNKVSNLTTSKLEFYGKFQRSRRGLSTFMSAWLALISRSTFSRADPKATLSGLRCVLNVEKNFQFAGTCQAYLRHTISFSGLRQRRVIGRLRTLQIIVIGGSCLAKDEFIKGNSSRSLWTRYFAIYLMAAIAEVDYDPQNIIV